MSSRTKHPRKAATTVTYDDPPEFNELDSGSEEDSEGSRSGGARRASEGKGKGKQRAREEDESSDEEEERAPKKRKTAKGKAKGKGGKGGRKRKLGEFELIKELPVEVLLQIFSQLTPAHLLAISALNKWYRSLLVTPTSAHVWRSARESISAPEVVAGGITEYQCAVLLFGKWCQRCGRKASSADFDIRERICQTCREENFASSDILSAREDLHPLAMDCVLSSWASWTVDVNKVEYHSQILWDLQYDLDSDENNEESEEEDDSVRSVPTGPRRHPDGSINYAESSSEDEKETVTEFKLKPSRKALAYASKHQKFNHAIYLESHKLRAFQSTENLKEYERKQSEKHVKRLNRLANYNRMIEVRRRIVALNLGFAAEDFTNRWFSHKLVNNDDDLDDETWDVIKPKLVKLLQGIRRTRVKNNILHRKRERQSSLRRYYEALKLSLPSTARPYLPLFLDFLLFPSVIPLWEEEGDITDEVWADSLDEIKEEIEQYRVDLCAHAREAILEATTDPDEVNVEEDELDLSDDFFAKATSFVCCDFTDCDEEYSLPALPGSWRRWQFPVSDENSVGPLVEVLEHQHVLHDGGDCLSKAITKNPSAHAPSFHISLPLEVACAVSAVVELADLGGEAVKSDLKRADARGRWEWENPPKRQGWSSRSSGCFGLFRTVKRAADKASHAKPPRILPPPVIVLVQDPKDRLDVDQDDALKSSVKNEEVKKAADESSKEEFWDWGSSSAAEEVVPEDEWW